MAKIGGGNAEDTMPVSGLLRQAALASLVLKRTQRILLRSQRWQLHRHQHPHQHQCPQVLLTRGFANNLPLSDPWKLLGISRGATLQEIKAVRAC